jgi:hypothetical protein
VADRYRNLIPSSCRRLRNVGGETMAVRIRTKLRSDNGVPASEGGMNKGGIGSYIQIMVSEYGRIS